MFDGIFGLMTRTATIRTFSGRTGVSRTAYQGFYLAIGHSMTLGNWTSNPDGATERWTHLLADYLATTYGDSWWHKDAALSTTTAGLGQYKSFPAGGRHFWQTSGYRPTVVTIQATENQHKTGPSRTGTYANDAEGLTAYQTDMPEMIARLVALGVDAANILILGMLPWNMATADAPGRYYGGSGQAVWYDWNGLETDVDHPVAAASPGQVETIAAAAGCTYVPLFDVYGSATYNPTTTITYTRATNDPHPNTIGHAAIATRVIANLPDLTSFLGRTAT